MSRLPAWVVGGAAFAALLLYTRRSEAAAPFAEDPPEVTDNPRDIPADFDFNAINWLDAPIYMGNADDNVRAFLYAIRMCEHRPRDVATGDDYRTFYGGSNFFSFADHPVATGEKQGIRLPAEWCRRAGFASGVCVSTAAGAYQFTLPTWREFRAAGTWGPRLPDFSPLNQDEAARRILQRIGALDAVQRGDLATALQRASVRWASLPGSTSGQPQKSLEYFAAKFNEALQAA